MVNNAKSKKDFNDKISEINEIYEDTLIKLEKLNIKKIKLIKNFHHQSAEQQIKKIINDIKNQ